jgi:cystathionine beta-lyase
MAVSPDDASLALRGLQTLGVRLTQLEHSALVVARWLSTRPEIETVLHPALASCPGHGVWKRDFVGSASVFSIVFSQRVSKEEIISFIDHLRLFKIGYSWGGVTSLAIPYFNAKRKVGLYGHRLVRLNIGLEEREDLIADLDKALSEMSAGR